MKGLARLYQVSNLLSLDVAVGAVVSALLMAYIMHVRLMPWGLATLGLTVWMIYTTDHLLDARRLKVPASTERHRFHQHHFNKLLIALSIAVLMDVVLISFIKKPVFNAGLMLGSVVGIYLLLQRNLKSMKEFSGALLYCAGVALPALSLSEFPISLVQKLFIGEFAIIVLCNLLLFSLFDRRSDVRDHQHSFVTAMGEQPTKVILTFFFIVNSLLIIFQLFWFSGTLGIGVVMLTMNLVLWMIFLFPGFFQMKGRYRLIGDAIFLIPLFFLLKV